MALMVVPPWERSTEDIEGIRSLPDHAAVLNGLKDEEAEDDTEDEPCEHSHVHCVDCGGCNLCDRAGDHDDEGNCPHGCDVCEALHTCPECGHEPTCSHNVRCEDCGSDLDGVLTEY
jgi:hypothetical protein